MSSGLVRLERGDRAGGVPEVEVLPARDARVGEREQVAVGADARIGPVVGPDEARQERSFDLVEAHVHLHARRRWLETAQRQLAGEHLVKHHAQRVNIRAVIHLARRDDLLRRHVLRRAHHHAHHGHHRLALVPPRGADKRALGAALALSRGAGEAPVHHEHFAEFTHHEVLRLVHAEPGGVDGSEGNAHAGHAQASRWSRRPSALATTSTRPAPSPFVNSSPTTDKPAVIETQTNAAPAPAVMPTPITGNSRLPASLE